MVNEENTHNTNPGTSSMFEGPIRPLLVRLSLPILAGMFFQLLYNLVDTWFVSRIDLANPSYVGGVGLIFPIIFLFIALGNGIMVGVSSLVARAIGENNSEVLDRSAESGLVISVVITIISLLLLILFGKNQVGILGARDDFFTHGYHYLIWVSPAAVFIFLGNVFYGILQGEGLMKHVMKGMILGTLINIILDPVFIFLLHLDVRGAALATVIGQMGSFAYVLRVFLKNRSSIRIHWKWKNISLKVIQKIIVIGLPQSMSMILMALSFLYFNRLVISIDPLAMTAFALFGRFEQLVLMPSFALSSAVVTIVGQNTGRGLYDRTWAVMKQTWLMGIGVVMVLAGIMVAAAGSLYAQFSGIPEVVDYAVRQTWTMEFFYVCALVGIVNRSFFQGIGYPMPAFILTLLRTILLSLPLSYLYVRHFGMGVEGVWWGLNTASILTVMVSVPWLRMTIIRLKKGALVLKTTSS